MRRLPWPAAVLALGAIAAGASPAAASAPLAPGDTRQTVVVLPSSWTAQADRLGVSVTDLDQQENGCLHPETVAGDTSCASADGELAEQLTATVEAGVLTDGDCVISGTAAPLSLLGAAETRLSVSGASCLSLRLDFDDAGAAGDDDNLAQSDSLSFSLRIVAEGPDGVSASDRDTATVVPDAGPAGAALPAGAADPAGSAGAAGAAVVAAGAQVPGAQVPGPQVPGAQVPGAQVPAGTSLGQIQSQVELGKDTVAVQTESSTTSFGQLVLLWGSVLVGAVLVGWRLFLVRHRRRQGRTA